MEGRCSCEVYEAKSSAAAQQGGGSPIGGDGGGAGRDRKELNGIIAALAPTEVQISPGVKSTVSDGGRGGCRPRASGAQRRLQRSGWAVRALQRRHCRQLMHNQTQLEIQNSKLKYELCLYLKTIRLMQVCVSNRQLD